MIVSSPLLSSPLSFSSSSNLRGFFTCLLPARVSALSHSPQVPPLPSSRVCSLHSMSTASHFPLQSPSISLPSICSKLAGWSHSPASAPARPLLLGKIPPLYSTKMVLTEVSKELCWPHFGVYPPPESVSCFLYAYEINSLLFRW